MRKSSTTYKIVQMPEQDLRVALVQTELYWESPQSNLNMLEEMLWEDPMDTDLVVLPEMFTSGFTMNASKVSEPMRLTTHRWMEQQAKQLQAAIMGSFVAVEDKQYFNRLVFMRPDGTYEIYDKRHLFRMAGEDKTYTGGNKKLVVEWKGWKLLPQVCYDLRFPVWSRNWQEGEGEMGYDCALFIANWPQPRVNAWRTLLQARAIENLSCCIGVNRVGEDGLGVPYNGQSIAVNAKGEVTFDADDRDGIFQVSLEALALNRLREKFPAYLDADAFELTPRK